MFVDEFDDCFGFVYFGVSDDEYVFVECDVLISFVSFEVLNGCDVFLNFVNMDFFLVWKGYGNMVVISGSYILWCIVFDVIII